MQLFFAHKQRMMESVAETQQGKAFTRILLGIDRRVGFRMDSGSSAYFGYAAKQQK